MVPSQVTPPPVGAAHSAQDVVPQLVTRLLLTQRPPQVWYPTLQAMPHTPPTHWGVPLGSVEQTVQDAPHDATSVSAAQLPPHL